MQRITNLTKIFWFALKPRHCLFRLWDTFRSVKHYVIAPCRLLTLLVQAMLALYNSSESAKGHCQDSCFCLVVLLTLETPIQPYFFVSVGLKLEGVVAYCLEQQWGCWENTWDAQRVLYSTLLCMGREKCNLFYRTFLLCCQEMPAGFSPLDEMRIEWFRWHYWIDDEFSNFPTTPFPFWVESGIQQPGSQDKQLDLLGHRLVTSGQTSSLVPPLFHLSPTPQLSSLRKGGYTDTEGRWYPRHALQAI